MFSKTCHLQGQYLQVHVTRIQITSQTPNLNSRRLMDLSFMDITVVLNLGTITKRISVKLKTASFGTTWIDMSLVVVHLSFCPLNIRIRR